MKSILKYALLSIAFLQTLDAFSQDVTSGRIAYYPFDGNAQDEAGDNNAVVYGAKLSTDRFGNSHSAFDFDGVDDYIEIPHDPLLNFGAADNFSISVWIKLNPTQKDLEGTNSGIISKWNEITSTSYPYAIRYWNKKETSTKAEKVFALRYDNACSHNPIVTSNCKIISSEWHHIVLIKSDNKLLLYQDGILQGTQIDNTVVSCDTKNDFPILIGKRNFNQRYFTGLIDDISFYNRALTADEVKLLFKKNSWDDLSREAIFKTFEFPEQTDSPSIDSKNNTIDVKVSCDADVTSLIANFNISNGAIATINKIDQISGVSSNNFTNPLTYQITAEDGCSTENWLVRVTKEQLEPEEIEKKLTFLSFSVPGQIGTSIIDNDNNFVDLVVNCSVNISELTADFSLPDGSFVSVKGAKQISGISVNNFSQPLSYNMSTSDRCATDEWTVRIRKQQLSQDEIDKKSKFLSFSLPGQVGNSIIDIESNSVAIVVECDSDLTNLIPNFSLPDGSYASVKGMKQISGVSVINFSQPAFYLISTIEGCMLEEWTVQVEREQLDQEEIENKTKFLDISLPSQVGGVIFNIDEKTVDINVKCDADLTDLKLEFSLPTGSRAFVFDQLQVSGSTSNDFNQPVPYFIRDSKGCAGTMWTVKIANVEAGQEEKENATTFNNFTIPGQVGESLFDNSRYTVAIEMPCGYDLTSLIPKFDLPITTVASIQGEIQESQKSRNNFSHTVLYEVSNIETCHVQEWRVTVFQKPLNNVDFNTKEFFLPNVITPNKDKLNDTFQIGDRLQNSALSIYNRYGRRIYFSSNYQNDFAGDNVSSGIYFYTIKSPCFETLIKGHLQVFKN